MKPPDTQVALAERLYDALARGDAEALDSLLAPDFVGVATPGLPFGLSGTFVGRERMRDDFWWQIGRNFRAAACPRSFEARADGRLQVSGDYVGTARATGRELRADFVHVIAFDGGRITALEQLTDAAAWQAAASAPLAAIDYSVVDGVAQVVLNRPDQRNAITQQVAEDTLTVAQMIAGDRSVRAVLIRGEGGHLTVGGDIRFFVEHGDDTGYGRLLERMTTPFHQAFAILSEIDAPIVTAASGAIAGGGLGFVYAADICVAADNARFVSAFAGIGLSGDGGGTWHLPRLVGPRRAAEIYLRNPTITASQALEWGMVNEVVPADELVDRATALAAELADGPTRAFGRMRRLLRESWTRDLRAQLAAETAALTSVGDTADAREGVAAFLENRQPTFQGQ